MLTKTVISYLLNVEKNWNSGQPNLSLTLYFHRKCVVFFDAAISTEKSTNLLVKSTSIWGKMKCNCNKFRHANFTYRMQLNIYVTGVLLSNGTQITRMFNFHPRFCETMILSNFYIIDDEKSSFLPFSTTRVELGGGRVTWFPFGPLNVFVYISHIHYTHFEGDYRNWWLTRALLGAIQLEVSRSNMITHLCKIRTWYN